MPVATSTLAPTETSVPTASITSTPFVPKAIIKIFSQSPLSGNQAIFGIDILRGAEQAVVKLGGPLRQLGYQVEVAAYDDRNNPDTARSNAEKIASDASVLCGIGHYNSRATVAAADVYHQAQLALVAPAATTSGLTARGYPEINRLIGRDDWQGIAAAQFAKAQGVGAVYIVSHKNEYGVRNSEHFRAEVTRLGLRVLGLLISDINPQTIPGLLNRMLTADPPLVYVAATSDEAISFLKAARAAGYEGVFLGLDDLNNPPAISVAGQSLIEGGGLYLTIPTAPANLYPAAAGLIADFGIHYGTSPLLFAARAYDAAGICISAIESSLLQNDGGLPSRRQVAAAVRATQDYPGITGTYTFNRQGDPVRAEFYIYRIVSVDPANWGQNVITASYIITPP